VRFGKFKMLKASGAPSVTLTINGEECNVTMKVGANGQAYFPRMKTRLALEESKEEEGEKRPSMYQRIKQRMFS
jgi:phosphatidate phosphatase PAH1